MKKIILLSFSILIFNYSFSQFITTIAGNGYGAPLNGGYSGDGGPALAAELNWPYCVLVDASGSFYIADDANNRIREVTGGIINTFAGNGIMGYSGDGGAATAAELYWPSGVAKDAAGNIYIADQGNNRIRKVDLSGTITTVAGSGIYGFSGDGGQASAAELRSPIAVAFDTSGNLYIADDANSRIRKVNKAGIITTIAGNGTSSYSGDGGPATAAEINQPYGVAVDASKNVYIADNYNNRIRKIDTFGIITTIAGNGIAAYYGDGGPATAAELSAPGVALDQAGNVYIADENNSRIREVNSLGIIYTVAGNGIAGFSGDGGAATAAEMYGPNGLAIDASGNMYIVDYYNQRIREVTPEPLAINELITKSEEVRVYPNPNNGIFQLGIRNYQLGINNVVEIYNMLGEKIYSKQLSIVNSQLSIDISGQPAGIYLYRLITETGDLVSEGKFVIE